MWKKKSLRIPATSFSIYFFLFILSPGKILVRLVQWWSMGEIWPTKLVCTALLPRREASQFCNTCSFSAPSASRWSQTRTGCGVSSVGNTWNSPGSSPEPPAVVDPPLSRTAQFPGLPFYFNHPAWVAAVQLSGGGGGGEPGAGEKSFRAAVRKRKWVKALPGTPKI